MKRRNVFTMQKYDLKKKSSKTNQNPSRYDHNSVPNNLKFQQKAKISSFKNPHIKNRLIIYDLGAKIP